MCGIGGILSKGSKSVSPEALHLMSLKLAHRGPDDSGVFVSDDRSIGLVHRRLSIIDLSPEARQPMSDLSGNIRIVFNGEIYNYPALREELSKQGVAFKTHSDTEVILSLYRLKGEACVEDLRGMFAFAVWDEDQKTLFMARDRMGIKPLYYAETQDYFLFASEIRSIAGSGLLERRLDRNALEGFLSLGSVPSPLTMMEGIGSLPPAAALRKNRFETSIRKYWKLAFGESSECAPAILRERLEDAVKSHLVSDVPVGLFLSGGIDSSMIAALMRRVEHGDLRTFSISFPGDSLDEGPLAAITARKFRTNHTEKALTGGDLMESLPGILDAMDQPTVDGVNTYFVSRLAREGGVKVVLSGLGGDELFGGYPSARTVPALCRAYAWMSKVPLATSAARAALALAPPTSQTARLSQFFEQGGTPEAGFLAVRRLFLEKEKAKFFSSKRFDPHEYLRNLSPNGGRPPRPAETAAFLEMRAYMHNQLLKDADVMAMAHGVEVRVPLLDHKLVEFVNGISWREKIAGRPKALLVSALGNEIPPEILNRPKTGFTFPFQRWMTGELRSAMDSFFNEKNAPIREYLNPDAMKSVWENFLKGKAHWSKPWSLFVLGQWMERIIIW